MAHTDINSEDRLVQATFAEHLEKVLGWESVYAWNDEAFGPDGSQGRADTREVVLNGMLAHDRLLDLVENFILFDASKPGAVRKVVARNHLTRPVQPTSGRPRIQSLPSA
jgi:type I site-specific restriction-modification system R (restriction) subunit